MVKVLNGTMQDFYSAIAAGKVNGHFPVQIVGTNADINNVSFTDITDTGGIVPFPTSAETLELVSDGTDDDAGGTGALTVIVTTLDGDFNEVTQIVTMDGTDAVALTGTHLRTRAMRVATAGSDVSNRNIGTITLQQTGAGNIYQTILPGKGATRSAVYTVPAGFTFHTLAFDIFAAKGDDAKLQTLLTPLGGATFIAGGRSTYQQSAPIDLTIPPNIPAKTDIRIQGLSTLTSSDVTVLIEAYISDNMLDEEVVVSSSSWL